MFFIPVMIRGGVDETYESWYLTQPMIQSLIYFSREVAAQA